MYRHYVELTKPGIVLGNLLSITGGFLLASTGDVNWLKGALTAAGGACVIASACVLNNIVDSDIDSLMERTRDRVMVVKTIQLPSAIYFCFALLAAGLLFLQAGAETMLPVALMIAGYLIYVGAYTFFLKRNSIYGTLAGSVAGAMPPVAGYCAVSGHIDAAALSLLLMFSLWQMPHSYAIAMFRSSDYRAAAIPVFPLLRGGRATKIHIVIYILAFILATSMLAPLGYVGMTYIALTLSSGLYWLYLGLAGFTAKDDVKWARKLFVFSIVVMVVLNIAMSLEAFHLDRYLPSLGLLRPFSFNLV